MNDERFYLVRYEIRQIQNYIFQTSRIKSIKGGSLIVSNYLLEALKDVLDSFQLKHNLDDLVEKAKQMPIQKILTTDFQEGNFRFYSDLDFQMAFFGGGSLHCIIKGEENAKKVSIALAKKLMKETGLLRVVYAYAELKGTESFDDFENARMEVDEKIRDVKLSMPKSNIAPALPFVYKDSITGFPYTHFHFDNERKFHTTPEAFKDTRLSQYDFKMNPNEKFKIDELVDKGTDSYIAVMHIDGNNIGETIKILLEKKGERTTPEKAKKRKRTIFELMVKESQELSKEIFKAFNSTAEDILNDEKDGIPYKAVVNSGDDITIIVKATDAFGFLQRYLRKLQNNEKNYFSACAGIAFVRSHFPFEVAYRIAEQCCDIAKADVKKDWERNKKAGHACAFSYYVVQGGMLSDVESSRAAFGELESQPYYVYKTEEHEKSDSLEWLLDRIDELKGKNPDLPLPRHAAKEIRGIYEQAYKKNSADYRKHVSFAEINSRLPKGKHIDAFLENKKPKYYDASVLMDFVESKEE